MTLDVLALQRATRTAHLFAYTILTGILVHKSHKYSVII